MGSCAPDCQLHFIAGVAAALLAVGCWLLAVGHQTILPGTVGRLIWIGLLSSVVIGSWKEAWDYYQNGYALQGVNNVELRDFYNTALGGLVGVPLVIFLHGLRVPRVWMGLLLLVAGVWSCWGPLQCLVFGNC